MEEKEERKGFLILDAEAAPLENKMDSGHAWPTIIH